MKPGVVVADTRKTLPFQTYSAFRVSCKTHICEVCAKRRRAEIAKRIRYFITSNSGVHLLTLTLKAGKHKIGEISAFWKKLRARLWKAGRAFKFFLVREFTKKGTEHLHILIDRKLPKGFISKVWKEITGDSFIVDIRKADEGAVMYLSKYLAKSQKSWRLILLKRMRLFSHSKNMMLGQCTKLRLGSLVSIHDSYSDALYHADELNRESASFFISLHSPLPVLSEPPPF